MIISKKEFLTNKSIYLKKFLAGEIFIYPTDTIYGIGCLASNKKSVEKIREIKNRDAKPFSVIAPSKKWIEKNCFIDEDAKAELKKLPGAYTFILKLRDRNISPNENLETLGVRIPKHWSSKIIEEIGEPIITTSVNLSGESYMTSLENLNEKIKSNVNFIIYDGELNGAPSKVINLITKERIR